MGKEKRTYKIRRVELNSSFTNTYECSLEFDNLKVAQQVVQIAKPANWEIYLSDGSFEEEAIERSPEYQARLDKEENEKEAWKKLQSERVAKINLQPKMFKSNIALPAGVEIFYRRLEARFNPQQSKAIQLGLQTVIKIKDEPEKSIWTYEYVTRSKNVQVKKFASDMKRLFGDFSYQMDPEMIREIVAEYDSLDLMLKNL